MELENRHRQRNYTSIRVPDGLATKPSSNKTRNGNSTEVTHRRLPRPGNESLKEKLAGNRKIPWNKKELKKVIMYYY